MADSTGHPIILITNDDGFRAPGLLALTRALEPLGRVVVVAPEHECSGVGHGLTLRRPLRITAEGPDRYSVDGTPTDCVHLGVYRLARERRPSLVVSGINAGLNVGDDVTYSGTVAGALEGTLLQVPSIAVSLDVDPRADPDFTEAAHVARMLSERVLERKLERGTFLNVNVPAEPVRGVRITRQGKRRYRASVMEREDPSGRAYFWIGGSDNTPADEPDGDHLAVREGFVSVCPLHTDLTHPPSLARLAEWDLALS